MVDVDPILRRSDKIASAGSCFAANIVPYLEGAGFHYLRTEQPSSDFADIAVDRFGYARYSAAYGNIYSARQLLQLLQRCQGKLKVAEDRWYLDGAVVDPLRPGLSYPAQSDQEFDLLTAEHLARTREVFEKADVFIFTLGLTECWLSKIDGTVFPACPGTVAGTFDPQRHGFVNFSATEIADDLAKIVDELRSLNKKIRVILTVSPVPLVATATPQHVLTASTYSKAALRVACAEAETRCSEVLYFPAFEIVTGPQSPGYFEQDLRNVSAAGVAAVMEALLSHCEEGGGARTPDRPTDAAAIPASSLSSALAKFECEEMMMDRHTVQETKPVAE